MAQFEKGMSGNPCGRPKGLLTGRARALHALDQVVSKEENMELIEAALEKALREKTLWFFTSVIMPLLPKETRGVLETKERIVEWRGLVDVGRLVIGADGEEVVKMEPLNSRESDDVGTT